MTDTQRKTSSPRPQRSEYAHFVPVPTRWADNDSFGHLNNAVYYSLFDTAVTRFLIETDLAVDGRERMFFVVETGCRYLAEAAYPDHLTVGLRIGHLGTSSIRYEIGVFRNDEDLAVATGLFVHVNIDPQTRRPVALDERSRDILARILR
ncbi:acyl-CoA thioesterase [Aureimonas fodinaquatilis]|uniref:Acyl-CoA thioesterase n=1 Tax=Aureimonas fodinaquatilis TaxID=2565783 RepID=A0A5B0DYY0_9HYPH|nr:thioesterase family protein [Aureimonas fodinaquatilis]KAA0972027.1 acyl-CoA thioesterase [Aureimonas fodinaquatilis]